MFILSLPHYIDSSMLTTWRSCKRKHFWSSPNALYPTGKSVHLVAGGAIAAGVEAVRKWIFLKESPGNVPLDDMLQIAYPAFLLEWGDYEAPENHTKGFIHTWTALAHYLGEYHPGLDPIQPYIRPDGTPAVEYTFSIPLEVEHPNGDPFVFTGRFDMLGVYRAGGMELVVPLDEKSTTSLGFSWQDQWTLRGQFIGYTWACQQAGLPVDHVAVRGIAIQKTQNKVVTALPYYAPHIVDRWYRQLLKDVQGIKEAYIMWDAHNREGGSEEYAQATAAHYYPYNFADACASYGGCAFQTLCEASDPEPFFTNYIRHRWDPLAKQPVKEITNAS